MKNCYRFTISLAVIFLCSFSCRDGYREIYHDIEHPFICFVNQSDDTVWVEVLLPDDFASYKGLLEDSIFYGLAYWNVKPHAMQQIWINHSSEESNYRPFAARVFVMESESSININHARFEYYKKECGLDSMQVIQILKEFEQKHLHYKHWYTKEELDNINWTIVYPQKL